MDKLLFPKKPFRGYGGAKVAHFKNAAGSGTQVLPTPSEIIIPMAQHIGKPATPCVSRGDHVYAGQRIAEPSAFVSSPIHSSVSGTVKKIDTIALPGGSRCEAVFIEPDFKDELCPTICPPKIETREELIKAAADSGAVGLGGAGFPTSVKLNFNSDSVDTLLVNAAECEPYITSDHREMLENPDGVISGCLTLLGILGFSRVIIGVEENKRDAINILNDFLKKAENPNKSKIKVLKLKTRYPQGAEKMLVHACTKRVVPAGKLPLDVGCVVINVSTLCFLSEYFKTGIPLIKRRITIDGTAAENPVNVWVPIGTQIKDILAFAGVKDPKKIILGGPMMGVSVDNDLYPIVKQNNAVIAFAEKEAYLPDETACIHCGRCVTACPMLLEPVTIAKAADRGDFASLEKLDVVNCIECGCCAYVCPAKIFVTQQMKVAKGLLRDFKKSSAKQ